MAVSDADWLDLAQRPRSVDSTEARAQNRRATDSPSMTLLVLVATIGLLAYATFLFNPAHRGDTIGYLLVISAESILMLQALLSLWTILSSGYDPRGFRFHDALDRLYDDSAILDGRTGNDPSAWTMHLHTAPVSVDVFITTYGEPIEIIRQTVAAAVAMHGRHSTFVLDDGRSDVVRDVAAELGAGYLRRTTNEGAKAGNINHALAETTGDLFVIFDADFVPQPNFLHETIPFFADQEVAFVQTPQHYGNLSSLISRGAGYMQSVFYGLIQPGKNRFNAAFCVGTNVVFRRRAIAEIGGIYQASKSEDVWTSILLHEKGWTSVYIPTVLATGATPETIEDYAKQQLRWATGGFEILLRHNPFSRKRQLTLDQRLQYFGTGTFYLTGIVPLLLLLVPPLQIYFDVHPVNLDVTTGTWLVYYGGFYLMQILVAFYTVGSFRWETLMLATVSFPIYTKALVNAVLRRDQAWHVTGRTGRASSPFNVIVPQVLFFVFLLATTAVGTWKDLGNGSFTLALAWNATNTVVLGVFVATAFREHFALRRAARVPRATARDTIMEVAA
jgi:cellulose synthase (UDP-forming)